MAKLCLLFCLLMTLSTCYGHLGFIGDIISGARERVHNDLHKVATAVGGVLTHGANLNIGGHVNVGHDIEKPVPGNSGEKVVVIIEETTGGSGDNGYQDAKGYGIPNNNGYNYPNVPNSGLNFGHQPHYGHGYQHHHGGYGYQHSQQGNFEFGGHFQHGMGYNQQGYRPNPPPPQNNYGGYGQPHQGQNHGHGNGHFNSNENNNNSPVDNITPCAPTQNNMNQNNFDNPQNIPNNNVQSTTQKTNEASNRPIWPSNDGGTTKKPDKNDEPLFVPLNPNDFNYQGDKTQVKEPKRETQDKPADEDEEFPIDVRFKDE